MTYVASTVAYSRVGTLATSGHACPGEKVVGVITVWDPSNREIARVELGTFRIEFQTDDGQKREFESPQSVKGIAFSPDGQCLAAALSDNSARIWEAKTQDPVATLVGHTRSVNSVAFAPDGRSLVTGSHDQTVRLWSVPAGKLIRTIPAGE